MKTSKKNYKKRKTLKRNIAKGPKPSLGKSSKLPPIGSSVRKTNKSNRVSVKKRVKINTPENELYEYSLGSSEREWKKNERIRDIPKCKKPKFKRDFPCKIKRTIFNNFDDYLDYLQLKQDKNYSTGYKSKEEHYDDIEAMLMWKGSDLFRK